MQQTNEESLELVRAAAFRGVHQAQVLYGQMLLDGNLVERNPSAALHWFERAAQGGNLMAVNMVGRCFDQGWGVAKSAYMAEMWFRKAADLGHVKSLNILGGFYEDGWVVSPDRTVARDYYRRAAIGGDFRGQFNYARFLIPEGDLLGALHWLRQVPGTATPAFIHKMKEFLATLSHPEIKDFALSLAESPQS